MNHSSSLLGVRQSLDAVIDALTTFKQTLDAVDEMHAHNPDIEESVAATMQSLEKAVVSLGTLVLTYKKRADERTNPSSLKLLQALVHVLKKQTH